MNQREMRRPPRLLLTQSHSHALPLSAAHVSSQNSGVPSLVMTAQKPTGLLSPLHSSRKPSPHSSLVGGEMVSGCHPKLKSPKSPCRMKEKSLFWTMSAMMGTAGQSQRGQSSQDHGWWRITSCLFLWGKHAIRLANVQNVCEQPRPSRWHHTSCCCMLKSEITAFPSRTSQPVFAVVSPPGSHGASDHV